MNDVITIHIKINETGKLYKTVPPQEVGSCKGCALQGRYARCDLIPCSDHIVPFVLEELENTDGN